MLKLDQGKWTLAVIIVAALLVGAIGAPELRAFAAAVIGSADIMDESILSVDIKNGEVKNSDLATDAVTGAKIQNLSIKTSDLGNSIVTSGKIKDGTIQKQDIAPGVLPTGASRIVFGSCDYHVTIAAHSAGGGACSTTNVLGGDNIIASIRDDNFDGLALGEITFHDDCLQDEICNLDFALLNNADYEVDKGIEIVYIAFR